MYKVLLVNGHVVANVLSAVIEGDEIITEVGIFTGNIYQVEDSDKPIPVGSVYRNGEFHELMNTPDKAVTVITKFMDDFAAEKFYDNIQSAALRAGYPGPFHAEGTKYAQWMDNCWATCYTVLAEVQAGVRQIPTKSELLALMPVKPTFA